MTSVHTKLIDLKANDAALEVELHLTVPDGPALHVYTHCLLRDRPLTKEDCHNLSRFFSQLATALPATTDNKAATALPPNTNNEAAEEDCQC